MSWLDKLQPAKFRGILFYVDSAETTAGRKTVEHNFPGKDINYIEDLGRATRKFNFEAYFLGNDYNVQRDALITAFETGGEGDLNHPYLGDFKVKLIGVARIRETSADGGYCSMSLQFSESEPPAVPAQVIATQDALLDRVNDAIDNIVDAFEAVFDTLAKGQEVIDDISATVNNAVVAIETVKSYGKKLLSIQDSISNLKNNFLALVTSASDMAQAFNNIFTADVSIEAVTENLALKDFQKDEVINEPSNAALSLLIRQFAVIGAANVIPNIEFETTTQAAEIRDLISLAIDDLMDEADNDFYDQLYALRGALLKDIETRSLNLPQILIKTFPDTLPSLFIAYDLYEDIEKAPDLVERNNIVHPGFVPGGVPLEVLSRE